MFLMCLFLIISANSFCMDTSISNVSDSELLGLVNQISSDEDSSGDELATMFDRSCSTRESGIISSGFLNEQEENTPTQKDAASINRHIPTLEKIEEDKQYKSPAKKRNHARRKFRQDKPSGAVTKSSKAKDPKVDLSKMFTE